jgi:Na+/citrate or Na+/malate symporter
MSHQQQQSKAPNISCALTLVLTLINIGVLVYAFFTFPKILKKEVGTSSAAVQLELTKIIKNELAGAASKLSQHVSNKFEYDLPIAIEKHSPKIPVETGPAIFLD